MYAVPFLAISRLDLLETLPESRCFLVVAFLFNIYSVLFIFPVFFISIIHIRLHSLCSSFHLFLSPCFPGFYFLLLYLQIVLSFKHLLSRIATSVDERNVKIRALRHGQFIQNPIHSHLPALPPLSSFFFSPSLFFTLPTLCLCPLPTFPSTCIFPFSPSPSFAQPSPPHLSAFLAFSSLLHRSTSSSLFVHFTLAHSSSILLFIFSLQPPPIQRTFFLRFPSMSSSAVCAFVRVRLPLYRRYTRQHVHRGKAEYAYPYPRRTAGDSVRVQYVLSLPHGWLLVFDSWIILCTRGVVNRRLNILAAWSAPWRRRRRRRRRRHHWTRATFSTCLPRFQWLCPFLPTRMWIFMFLMRIHILRCKHK